MKRYCWRTIVVGAGARSGIYEIRPCYEIRVRMVDRRKRRTKDLKRKRNFRPGKTGSGNEPIRELVKFRKTKKKTSNVTTVRRFVRP